MEETIIKCDNCLGLLTNLEKKIKEDKVMLKIKDSVDLKELEKFGFKRVEFRKMFSDYVRSYQYEVKKFIDICDYHKCMQTDTIIIHDKDSVDYERNIQIIIEDHSIVDFGCKIVGMQEKTMSKLFDIIQAGLVEKF